MSDPLCVRRGAFRSIVVFRLGVGPGTRASWNPRTILPTLSSDQPIRDFALRSGLSIDSWFYDDGAPVDLEHSDGLWRPAIHRLSFRPDHLNVPSVRESADAFNRHVRPLERARATRRKYATLRLSVLTWAVWKNVLCELLPMSDDLLRAFIWDSLAFDVTFHVLKHTIDAVKAWHHHLGLQPPADGVGAYRRLTHSLARLGGTPRPLKFPIHAAAVRRLLLLPVPRHDSCSGPSRGCTVCAQFLLRWRDCLAGATGTVTCSRCAEVAGLQSCDLWFDFDARAGYSQWKGGAAVNVKVRKNDQFRHGHEPRIGVAADRRLDLVRQLRAFLRAVGNQPRPGCTKSIDPQARCPACPPLFPRSIGREQAFDLSKQPSAEEASAMIVRGLRHVGYDTALFSGISARKGGLSTAIEAGVPEHILWMQSGHAQDVAARRYLQLGSPTLLYRTWEAFGF